MVASAEAVASAAKWDWLTGVGERPVAGGGPEGSPLLDFACKDSTLFSKVLEYLSARDLLTLGLTCKTLCWEVMSPSRVSIWRAVYRDEIAAAGARAAAVGAEIPVPILTPLPHPLNHRDLVRAAVFYNPKAPSAGTPPPSIPQSRAVALSKKFGVGPDLVKRLPSTPLMLANNVQSRQVLISDIDWALRFNLVWALKWANKRSRERMKGVVREVDAINRRDKVANLLRSLGLNVALGMQHPVVAQVLAGGPIAKGLEIIEELVPSTRERSLRWTNAQFHPQVPEFFAFDQHDPIKAYVYHNLDGDNLFARAAALSARLVERDQLLGGLASDETEYLDSKELWLYLTNGEGRGCQAIRASALLRHKRAVALEAAIAATMHPRVRQEGENLIRAAVWFDPGPICGHDNALSALQAMSARLFRVDLLHPDTSKIVPAEVATFIRLGTQWTRLHSVSTLLKARDELLPNDEKRRRLDHFIRECDTFFLPTDPTSVKDFVDRNLH